jgi:hypothetical protein
MVGVAWAFLQLCTGQNSCRHYVRFDSKLHTCIKKSYKFMQNIPQHHLGVHLVSIVTGRMHGLISWLTDDFLIQKNNKDIKRNEIANSFRAHSEC